MPGRNQPEFLTDPPDPNPGKTGSDGLKGYGCPLKGQQSNLKV